MLNNIYPQSVERHDVHTAIIQMLDLPGRSYTEVNGNVGVYNLMLSREKAMQKYMSLMAQKIMQMLSLRDGWYFKIYTYFFYSKIYTY
ncbi:hypothetical protein ACB092_11G194000 [Castanea dentata]